MLESQVEFVVPLVELSHNKMSLTMFRNDLKDLIKVLAGSIQIPLTDVGQGNIVM